MLKNTFDRIREIHPESCGFLIILPPGGLDQNSPPRGESIFIWVDIIFSRVFFVILAQYAYAYMRLTVHTCQGMSGVTFAFDGLASVSIFVKRC